MKLSNTIVSEMPTIEVYMDTVELDINIMTEAENKLEKDLLRYAGEEKQLERWNSRQLRCTPFLEHWELIVLIKKIFAALKKLFKLGSQNETLYTFIELASQDNIILVLLPGLNSLICASPPELGRLHRDGQVGSWAGKLTEEERV